MSRHEQISVIRVLNRLIGRLERSKHSLRLGHDDRVVRTIVEAHREGKTYGVIETGDSAPHCLL
jgi:hypothetical protein